MRASRTAVLALAFALGTPAFAEGGQELERILIETASTPARHQALADHYRERAAASRREAERHRGMAKVYSRRRQGRSPGLPGTHCTKLAGRFDAQAEHYDALAAAHDVEAKK
jgi:hypothetical protein